jgi:CheY-like chemotaxis protein
MPMSQKLPPAILVVEDEWLIADTFLTTLEAGGFRVLGPAARVSEALELIAENGLDAAILDVSLRGETSVSIARVLAEKSVPFAFVTGYVSGGIPDDFKDHTILNKPLGDAQLLSCVRKLLEN